MHHCYWKSNDKVRSALEYYLKLMSRGKYMPQIDGILYDCGRKRVLVSQIWNPVMNFGAIYKSLIVSISINPLQHCVTVFKFFGV